jgi:hypothetical protein
VKRDLTDLTDRTDRVYQIEHALPIPPMHDNKMRRTLAKLEVGDSFLLEGVSQQTVYSAARRVGIGISTRKMDGEGVRVWRVA